MSNVIHLARRAPASILVPPRHAETCEVIAFPAARAPAPTYESGTVDFICGADGTITVDLCAPTRTVSSMYGAAEGAGVVEFMEIENDRGSFVLLKVSPGVAARMETVARDAGMRVTRG